MIIRFDVFISETSNVIMPSGLRATCVVRIDRKIEDRTLISPLICLVIMNEPTRVPSKKECHVGAEAVGGRR